MNIVVAGFAALEHFQSVGSVGQEDAATLRLLEERLPDVSSVNDSLALPLAPNDSSRIAHPQKDREVAGSPEVSSQPEMQTCLLIGPLGGQEFEESKQLLDTYGIEVDEIKTQLDAQNEFWVIVRPVKTFGIADEIIRNLGVQGFVGFHILQGEQRGGVSLGLFNDRSAAEQLLQRLASQNLDLEIIARQKPTAEIRLMTRSPVPLNLKTELLGLLSLRDSFAEPKEIICK